MILEIITTEKIFYRGQTEMVNLPGSNGQFTVLQNHAPMIAMVKQGAVHFRTGQKDQNVLISSGFVRIHHNVITVCVEHAEFAG